MIAKHLASFRNDVEFCIGTEDDNTASQTLKVSLLLSLTSAARCKTRRASSWSRDYNDLPHQVLYAMVGRLLFSLLQLCRQDFMPTYFLPQHFLYPFCQSKWLREPIMRTLSTDSTGLQQRRESDVNAAELRTTMSKNKEDTMYKDEEHNSYHGMLCIVHALFQSETDLEVENYHGSYANLLFEKVYRCHLINSIYGFKQEMR